MNIDLHIEQLVLDGLPMAPGQGREVRAALEVELARLLKERGMGNVSAGAIAHLPAASMPLPRGGQPADLGRQIARTLYDRLAPARAASKHP